MAGGRISFGKFGNAVVEVDRAAQLPQGCALYDEWQVAPAEGDIVRVTVGVLVDMKPAPDTCQCCCSCDADMLVVPSAYAKFVEKFRPMLQVCHMAMAANGQKVLTATTFVAMVPELHVRSIAFRLLIMDSSASGL